MQKYYRYFPAIVVATIIFVASSVPGEIINDAGLGNNYFHITGHFVLYVLLGTALFFAFRKWNVSLLAGIVYALTDEFHQHFVPGRAVQLSDLITDFVGIVIGLLISFYIWKSKHLLNKRQNH